MKEYNIERFFRDYKLLTIGEINNMVELYPYVYFILRDLRDKTIPEDLFIRWTQTQTTQLKHLPADLDLNSDGSLTNDTAEFADAVFTLAYYMKHLLKELKDAHVSVDDFNTVYGLNNRESLI
jgi:hypothetical protein